jgi:hypothetical protein
MIGNHLNIRSGLISMRPVVETDAKLIYDLRHSQRGKWLRPTSIDIRDQAKYISDYITRFEKRDEVYYVIADLCTGSEVGVTRITNLNSTEFFGWEGLIISEAASPGVAIDTIFLIYKIGFQLLGKKVCGPWGVRKDSLRVNRLHQIMSMAEIISEDSDFFYYSVSSKSFGQRQNYFESRGFGKIL